MYNPKHIGEKVYFINRQVEPDTLTYGKGTYIDRLNVAYLIQDEKGNAIWLGSYEIFSNSFDMKKKLDMEVKEFKEKLQELKNNLKDLQLYIKTL